MNGSARFSNVALRAKTQHIVHRVPVAPAHQPPATEARIGPHDDPHARPGLTQPLHQQLENRAAVQRRIDVAGPQVAHQQPVAAEHVQRQEAVAVVIAVKEAAFLFSVHGVMRGVEVQHDLLRRRVVGGDELRHEHAGQAPQRFAVDAVLQSAQRRRAGQRLVGVGRLLGQHRKQGIAAQRGVVVEVFVAQRDAEDALAQHRPLVVHHAGRIARIGQAGGQRVDQPDPPIDLAQQQPAAIRGEPPAAEIRADSLSPETGKQERPAVTLCHTWPPCLKAGNPKQSPVYKASRPFLLQRSVELMKYPG
jgi:hypothetical protein